MHEIFTFLMQGASDVENVAAPSLHSYHLDPYLAGVDPTPVPVWKPQSSDTSHYITTSAPLAEHFESPAQNHKHRNYRFSPSALAPDWFQTIPHFPEWARTGLKPIINVTMFTTHSGPLNNVNKSDTCLHQIRSLWSSEWNICTIFQ